MSSIVYLFSDKRYEVRYKQESPRPYVVYEYEHITGSCKSSKVKVSTAIGSFSTLLEANKHINRITGSYE